MFEIIILTAVLALFAQPSKADVPEAKGVHYGYYVHGKQVPRTEAMKALAHGSDSVLRCTGLLVKVKGVVSEK